MLIDYTRLMEEHRRLSKFIKTGYIGHTECGRPIPYFFTGRMNVRQILICGATHAREYVTTSLIMLLIERSLIKPPDNLGVWFVPMVNCDGAELAIHGATSISDIKRRAFLKEINGGSDFSLFKANANGVDINNNFPARWGQDPAAKRVPATSGYIGKHPESERETRALINFSSRVKPALVISYHTKGEVVYWDFDLKGARRRDFFAKARMLSRALGYPLVGNGNSVGGYKDWLIETMGIYAYTVEVGDDSLTHPIGCEQLGDIYDQNKEIISVAGEILKC